MTKEGLVEAINWPVALAAPRYAGGHSEVMASIFGGRATVLEMWTDGDYQGTIVYSYEFLDGGFCVITDSYGSCSGCDAWEDASDDAARNMISSLVSSARFFATFEELLAFTERMKAVKAHYDEHYTYPPGAAEDYHFTDAAQLHEPLAKQLGARRVKESTDAEKRKFNALFEGPEIDRLGEWG